jgi:hypothetical protein
MDVKAILPPAKMNGTKFTATRKKSNVDSVKIEASFQSQSKQFSII